MVNASLVGIFEKGYYHPGGGRYPAFRGPIGVDFVPVSVQRRHSKRPLLNKIGYWIFIRFGRDRNADMHPYSFGLFVMELQVWLAMRKAPGRVFHSVKGETDVHNLPFWSRKTDSRLVVTYHDSPEFLPRVPGDYFRFIDGVVALCETQREYFAPLVGKDRVRVVHHGVDTETFVPAPELAANSNVISVGSYCRDYTTMNEAMQMVWEIQPDVRFLMVGTATAPAGFGPERLDDPRVSYIDGISDAELVELYHQSAMAAIPVWAATANNALLEAMSCGLPVVATDMGGMPEYLGDAGVTVEPIKARPLAEAIVSMLNDRESAATMGRAGRERAVRLFDYKVVAAQMAQFYEDVSRWPQAPATVPTEAGAAVPGE